MPTDLPKTHRETGLSVITNEPPRALHSWSLVTLLSMDYDKLVGAVLELQDEGLSGMQFLKTRVCARVCGVVVATKFCSYQK